MLLKNLWTYLVNWWNGRKPTVAPTSHKVTLFDVVTAYNTPYIAMYPLGTGTIINAQIFKNDTATNQQVADLITSEAKRVGLDPLLVAALFSEESRFGVKTFNHNLCAEYPTITFERTDFGLAQINGSYLPSKPGLQGLTEQEMIEKAYDPAWAIPVQVDVIASNIQAAKKYLANDPALSTMTKTLNTTNLPHESWLGVLYYNKGQQGGNNAVKHSLLTEIKYPFAVAKNYDAFTNMLKV